MSLKAILIPLGCIIAWFVLLPVLVIGGGMALFVYAVVAESAAMLTGRPANTLDASAARDIARLCGAYRVPARSGRHFPLR